MQDENDHTELTVRVSTPEAGSIAQRVPAEVLQKIFTLYDDIPVVYGHIFAGARDKTGYSPYAWLAVTQVCRRWYNASIGYGPLWSRFFIPSIRSREFFELSLRRSKIAPLFVSFLDDPDEGGMQDATSWIMLHELLAIPDRVREIHVSTRSISGHRDVLKLLSSLGSRLRSCTVSTEPAGCRDAAVVPSFPGMHHDLPVLQHLRLWGLRSVHWDRIYPLVTLTHLDVRLGPTARVLVSRMVSCLAHLPLLKTLRLWNVANHGEMDPISALVPMNELRDIELQADPDFCSELLSRIRVPSDAQLRIRYEDVTALAPYDIAEPLLSLPAAPKSLMVRPVTGLKIYAWTTRPRFIPDSTWSENRMLTLSTRVPYKRSVAPLLANVPLQDVQLLIIKPAKTPAEREAKKAYEIDWKMAASEMHLWARCMPKLIELRLWPTRGPHYPLVKMFCGSSIPTRLSRKPLPWPNLRILVLYELDPEDAAALRDIGALLQVREDAGCTRLWRLVLHVTSLDTGRPNHFSLLSDNAEKVVTIVGEIDAEILNL